MNSDCTAVVRAVVTSISEQCRVVRRGEWCHVALPFETTGGHRVEVAISQVGSQRVLISDLGRTISELMAIGVDPAGNRARARQLEDLQRDFGLTRKNSELQIAADTNALGPTLLRFAGALKTISDMAYFHRVSAGGTTYAINLAIRSVLANDGIQFVEGEAARVSGALEKQIALDFAGTVAGHRFGVAVLGATGTKRLAEVWGFRFGDLRNAHPDLRRIAVYDVEEQSWSDDSLRILAGMTEFAVPSSRVEALPSLLRAA